MKHRKYQAPRILKMGSWRHWGEADTIKRPNQPRNVHTMCKWAKPTGKVGLVKAAYANAR